ncbi:MAG: thioredoxin-disulfide reductase [Dehalococcoidales bacterium]|nr:MAG: thioredoxin-disulfide reductase [Dehalococcoidales bacterium]
MPGESSTHDIIIIGGGPAGLTAGLYTSRARLSSLLIERGLVGGQITNAEQVENFPGFPEGISGIDLGQRLHDQATRFGLETILAEVTRLELQGDRRVVKTTEGDFTAMAVILAGGSSRQKLDIPGEEEFTGKGVSYCATCDAAFFQDQLVAVAGGGDAAITEALHLAKFSSKVTVVHRRNQLRATRILQEKAFAEPKIDFAWDSVVEKIEGKDFVQSLRLRNVKTDQYSDLEVAGVFVSIGFRPDTDYLKGLLPLDEIGHIITNEKMETKVAGVFAAGDIRQNSARQAITAAGDGATAAIYADKYLT